MEKYSKYKDSGIQSIGKIPNHWEVRHLRNFLTLFSEKGFGHSQLLSVTREKGVIVRDKENKEENHNFVPDDLSGYKHLYPGDFVINKMKSWQGSYGVSEYEGIVSPAYFTCKLKGVNPQFFSLAIRSKAYIGFFMQYSKGIRVDQWDLDPNSMKDIPFILPPIDEQLKIVPYLDESLSKIDEAIAQQQKKIDLLNERKQIIINNAVTKGLDPNVPMKDSGVEWIGMIPENWNLKRLHLLLGENSNKNLYCSERNQLQFNYGDIVQKSNQNVDEGIKKIISKYTVVCPNDIMINGLNLNYDFVSQRVAIVREHGIITSAYISLRPTNIASPRYYNYLLKAMDYRKMFHGMGTGIRLTLSYKELKNQILPVPSLSEQESIANYLDFQLNIMNQVIFQQQKILGLLNERKQIIINEVVTGKVKVS